MAGFRVHVRLESVFTIIRNTHLAHKAEHAVDLETGAVVGVTVQDADDGDTTTMVETLIDAADRLAAVEGTTGVAEVVGDKGYHSNATMVAFHELGLRSYVSEPDRGRRSGRGRRRREPRCMPIVGGYEGTVGSACCGSGASAWNVPMPTSTKQGGCAGCSCAAIPTS